MNKPKGDFKGFHHWYSGFLITMAGWFLGWKVNIWYAWIGCPLGLLICVDDWVQHFIKPKTPLRRLNNWLWRFWWYEKLCRWLDSLFGKRS